MNAELPNGWVLTTLETIAHWGSGGTPSRSKPELYGGTVPWFKTGELGPKEIFNSEETITHEALKTSSAKLFPQGSVVVAMYGATIGKVSILGREAATNQACAVGIPRAEATSSGYLYNYLRSQKEAFVAAGQGGAQPNISQTVIKAWPIPIAPVPEQKRITDKLDTVLTQVDAVNTRLARVAPILKRFRQSVLAAATSGRLTEDWRVAHRAADWTPKTVESLCLHISDGPFGSNLNSYDYTDGGARVVRLENIGHLSFDSVKETFVSLEKYETLKKHTLLPGDLLFSSFVDEEVRVCEFPANIAEPTINKADCFCVRVDRAQVDPRFLAFKLACKSTYQALKALVHGATRPRINLRQLRGFEVMLPSGDEQAEIVRRVATLFAFADRLEARLLTAQTATARLTPALLAKAFRGELVPQDTNDEPASELLRRLQQKAPLISTRRGRRSVA